MLALTDHDVDIVYGGVTFSSVVGIDASNIEGSAALDVDNLEVSGFLNAVGISESAVAAGLWDFAAVQVSRVNWRDLSMGEDKLKSGWLGQVSLGRNNFTNEVRGLTQKLQQTIGESYSPSCKANLFDSRCKVVATEGVWKFSSVTVAVVSDPARTFEGGGLTQTTDFFTAGRVLWDRRGQRRARQGDQVFHDGWHCDAAGADAPTRSQSVMSAPSTQAARSAGNSTASASSRTAKNHRGFPFLPGDDVTLRGY